MVNIDAARAALAELKAGNDEAWSEFEELCQGVLARDPGCQAVMVALIHGAAEGVPCCASCAHGGECEGDS